MEYVVTLVMPEALKALAFEVICDQNCTSFNLCNLAQQVCFGMNNSKYYTAPGDFFCTADPAPYVHLNMDSLSVKLFKTCQQQKVD
jgi:hypothetical protein